MTIQVYYLRQRIEEIDLALSLCDPTIHADVINNLCDELDDIIQELNMCDRSLQDEKNTQRSAKVYICNEKD